MPFTTPARAARPAVHPGRRRDVPAQAPARRDGRARRPCCGAGSSADVEANAPWQRLRRSLLLLLQLLLVVDPGAARGAAVPRAPGGTRPRHRPGHRHVGQHGAPRTSRRTGSRRRKAAAIDGAQRPADRRQGQRHRRRPDAPGSWSTRRPTSAASARRSMASSRPARAATSATRSSSPAKLAARSGDAQVLVATDAALATPADGEGRRPDHGPAGRARAQEPGDRRAGRPDGAVGGHPLGLRQRRQPRPRAAPRRLEVWGDDRAARGARRRARRPGAVRRRHRRRAARRRRSSRSGSSARDADRSPARRTSSPSTTGPGRSSRPTGTRLDPARRRGRPVPRDRALVPAERRAVRGDADRVRPGDASGRTARPWDLVIFEGDLPATLPRRRSWRSRPPATSPLGEVTGTLDEPGHRLARARTSRSCATSTCRRPTSPRPRS